MNSDSRQIGIAGTVGVPAVMQNGPWSDQPKGLDTQRSMEFLLNFDKINCHSALNFVKHICNSAERPQNKNKNKV
jgi:hypothetical protein